MRFAALVLTVMLGSLCISSALAASRGHHSSHSGISLRKRLNANDLIADPQSVEIDWSSLYSASTHTYALPSAVRWTPGGERVFTQRTEYSLSFDSLNSALFGGSRVTHFSDSLTAMATILPWKDVGFAVAPQVTYLMRGDSGWRFGGLMFGRTAWGANEIGGNAGWSYATKLSPTNPAGIFDAGGGYGRHMGKWLPHTNIVWERASGVPWVFSLFEGIEYQFNDRIAIDISGQHFSLKGGPPDHQIVIGFTINLPTSR